MAWKNRTRHAHRRQLVEAADPDIHLDYNQGGSLYYRPATEEKDRSIRSFDQGRMIDRGIDLFQKNPLAKRLVSRIVNYLLAGPITFQAENSKVQDLLDEWWKRDGWDRKVHDNVLAWRVTGELILPAVTNPFDGLMRTGYVDPKMVRAVRVAEDDGSLRVAMEVAGRGGVLAQIYRIIHEDHDRQSETYGQLVGMSAEEEQALQAWQELDERERQRIPPPPYIGEVFHWRANALPNQKRGLSDLWAIGDYVDAYEQLMWQLMTRAQIMAAFVAQMTHVGANEQRLRELRSELGTKMWKSGTLVHTNEKTTIQMHTPALAKPGDQVFSELILAVIATGGGVPDYWLNAQVDPNRASAEAMAVPIMRDFREVQRELSTMIEDMGRFMLEAAVRHKVRGLAKEKLDFKVVMPAVGEKSDSAGATVLQTVAGALPALAESKLLDQESALRVVANTLGLLGIEVSVEDLRKRIEKEEAKAKAEKDAQAAPPLPPQLVQPLQLPKQQLPKQKPA